MRRLARVSALEERLFARVLDAGEVVLHGDKDEGVRGDVVPVAAAVERHVVHLHHHAVVPRGVHRVDERREFGEVQAVVLVGVVLGVERYDNAPVPICWGARVKSSKGYDLGYDQGYDKSVQSSNKAGLMLDTAKNNSSRRNSEVSVASSLSDAETELLREDLLCAGALQLYNLRRLLLGLDSALGADYWLTRWRQISVCMKGMTSV